MGLRLSEEGDRALAQWHGSPHRTPERDSRIADVLMTIVDSTWHQRWYWHPDVTDPDARIILPDHGLAIVIRPYAADEPETSFDLVRIVILDDK